FQPPAELLTRWQEWEKLDKAVPSPAVYTPRLWRRYRELLLRYEHLVRADERAAAGKLSAVLHNLSVDLEEARGLRRDGGSAAYPYSEQVWPVVRAVVEEADAQRRAGEDLLFPNADRWPDESRKHLAEAEKLYVEKAFKDAGVLQNALATRDRALADLPFLTR